MRRLIQRKQDKKNARSIISSIMIMIIAVTGITWIGIMEINKK